MLGSNLPRDSRIQVALNNAPEGNSLKLAVSLTITSIIQAFLLMP